MFLLFQHIASSKSESCSVHSGEKTTANLFSIYPCPLSITTALRGLGKLCQLLCSKIDNVKNGNGNESVGRRRMMRSSLRRSLFFSRFIVVEFPQPQMPTIMASKDLHHHEASPSTGFGSADSKKTHVVVDDIPYYPHHLQLIPDESA
jgi:hypothetical protein